MPFLSPLAVIAVYSSPLLLLFEREEEELRIFVICGITPQMPVITSAEPVESQEHRAPSGFLMWVAGTQALSHHLLSPRIHISEAELEAEELGLNSGTGYRCPNWYLNCWASHLATWPINVGVLV